MRVGQQVWYSSAHLFAERFVMLAENYELIEAVMLNFGLVVLFGLMGYAIHDVLSKNNVPKIGRFVAYGVLLLGAAGFVAKGIIQIFWQSNGVG